MIGLLLLLLVLRHTNWPSENWPHYTQQRVGYDTKTLRGQRSFETIQISHHIFSFFYSLLFHGVLRVFPFLHRLSFCFLFFFVLFPRFFCRVFTHFGAMIYLFPFPAGICAKTPPQMLRAVCVPSDKKCEPFFSIYPSKKAYFPPSIVKRQRHTERDFCIQYKVASSSSSSLAFVYAHSVVSQVVNNTRRKKKEEETPVLNYWSWLKSYFFRQLGANEPTI